MINNLFKKATLTLLLVVAFSFALLGMGKIESEKPKTPFRVFDEETQRWIMPGHPEYTLWYYGGEDPAKGEEIYQDIVDGAVNNVIPAIIQTGESAIEYATNPETQAKITDIVMPKE